MRTDNFSHALYYKMASPTDDDIDRSVIARKRWQILKNALLKQKQSPALEGTYSVRRFSSFELFKVSEKQREQGHVEGEPGPKDLRWLEYVYEGAATDGMVSVDVCMLPDVFTLEEVVGFNNTGNVCVWPSEEVMAYYCLENVSVFSGKSVCELGGGMTCLAGVMLAATGLPSEVLLTDGNENSVKNLLRICDRNAPAFGGTRVQGCGLAWNAPDFEEKYSSHRGRYDVILCADCLFFTDVHQSLIDVTDYLLKPGGCAYMFSPSRNGTHQQFCELAKKYFRTIRTIESYHNIVQLKHEQFLRDLASRGVYDPDIHYPMYTVLIKY